MPRRPRAPRTPLVTRPDEIPALPSPPAATGLGKRETWRTFLGYWFGVPTAVLKNADMETYRRAYRELSRGELTWVQELARHRGPPKTWGIGDEPPNEAPPENPPPPPPGQREKAPRARAHAPAPAARPKPSAPSAPPASILYLGGTTGGPARRRTKAAADDDALTPRFRQLWHLYDELAELYTRYCRLLGRDAVDRNLRALLDRSPVGDGDNGEPVDTSQHENRRKRGG